MYKNRYYYLFFIILENKFIIKYIYIICYISIIINLIYSKIIQIAN